MNNPTTVWFKLTNKHIDTLLGLGLGLGLELEFPYVRTGDVCAYPHSFQAMSDLYPIKS